MAALLPNASVRLLPGIGHAAPLEAADVIADLVREAVGAQRRPPIPKHGGAGRDP